MTTYIFFWLVIALLFLLFELGSPGLFYFLSFAGGAAIASIAAALCYPLMVQAMTFIGASIAIIFILKKWVKKHASYNHYHSNVFALQGKQGIVIQPAQQHQFGQVQLNGELWAFRPHQSQVITEGDVVTVLDVRGAHVIVTKREKQN